MKLVLLIPTFVLMAISGYNLSVEFAKASEPNYLLFKAIHLTVFLISVACAGAIIKSMFTVRYVEVKSKKRIKQSSYNDIELQSV